MTYGSAGGTGGGAGDGRVEGRGDGRNDGRGTGPGSGRTDLGAFYSDTPAADRPGEAGGAPDDGGFADGFADGFDGGFDGGFDHGGPNPPAGAGPDDDGPDPGADRWYDAEAGPLVRLYALTRGRARPRHEIFDLVALITTRPDRAHYRHDPGLGPEHAAVLELGARGPRSVADLAADCDLPLNIIRVILSDLLEVGLIQVSRPAPPGRFPDERMLREVINGLRAL